MKPHKGKISSVLLWLRIIRPQTLFASLVPVLIGAHVVSRHDIRYSASTLTVTALCALLLQILSNLINDYYDYIRGTDHQGRVGYRRALAEGEVTITSMRNACLLTALGACLLGIWLVYTGGWVIVAIGLSALLFAWLYTATPYSLSYLGIADIFVFLYYGVIASCGTAWLLLSDAASRPSLLAATPIICPDHIASAVLRDAFFAGGVSGLISMCVLLINNLRDMDSDREVGKRTLPVRFGKCFSHAYMLILVLLMPVFAWSAFGVSYAMLIVIPTLLIWLNVIKAQGSTFNKLLLCTGLSNVIYWILVNI